MNSLVQNLGTVYSKLKSKLEKRVFIVIISKAKKKADMDKAIYSF